ncbi:hypothetical protein NPIL_426851, partial [Nephila pilipes]
AKSFDHIIFNSWLSKSNSFGSWATEATVARQQVRCTVSNFHKEWDRLDCDVTSSRYHLMILQTEVVSKNLRASEREGQRVNELMGIFPREKICRL